MAKDISLFVPMEAESSTDNKPMVSGAFNARLNHPIEIIKRFAGIDHKMKGNELEFYQLVNVLKQIKGWETNQQRDEFIDQIMDDPGLFTPRCVDMVFTLCHLSWKLFSPEMQVRFADFLTNVAAFNPIHVNLVLRSFVINCLDGFQWLDDDPIKEDTIQVDVIKTEEMQTDEKPAEKSIEQQREEFEVIFQLGIQSMQRLVPPNSMRIPLIASVLEKMKLHKSAPKYQFYLYFRLLITVADKYPSIAKDLWLCLVDCLLKFDGEVSSETVSNQMLDVRQIFPKDNEPIIDESDVLVNKSRRKLDMCMTMVFCYISLGVEQPKLRPADHIYTKWMDGMKMSEDFFSIMALSLESQILAVHELENVPFVWFYICLENRPLLSKLLDRLWKFVVTPFRSPNDWKKMQNAVTFISALLARADFVDIELAYRWLKQMIEWCVNYVNNARQVKYGGGIQHSTFYATVQAAFFLLCFRYREFNEPKMAEEIRLWGIARIVHSQLEPLNFIPRSLSLFFASISRYMQLVYCNHIVSMSNDQLGVETCFPFLHHSLAECSKYFQSHLRAFVPVENDLATINSIRSRRTTEVIADDNDFDFMEEDDGIEVDCE